MIRGEDVLRKEVPFIVIMIVVVMMSMVFMRMRMLIMWRGRRA